MRLLTLFPFVFLFVQQFDLCVPARILGVFPVPSISHQVVYRALIEELAKRGHHIVTITPNPLRDEAPPHFENVTEIDIHDVSYNIWNAGMSGNAEVFRDPMAGLRKYNSLMAQIVDAQLSVPAVKSLIQSDAKFDLVFAECLTSMSFAYAGYFKAPVIGISSGTGKIQNFEAVGIPTQPILYPDYNRRKLGNLSLWEKFEVLRLYVAQQYEVYRDRFKIDEIARKHFGDDIPSVAEVQNNIDMLFINGHPIMNGVRPTVPALVYMGNMHMQTKKKLPKKLKTLLDGSTRGVIYFSFGSNIKSAELPPQIQQTIISTLRELPYTVLWKFENETLPDKPENVHISKWFPQTDVLGHPNIKAFITQGGQQSLEEAISNEVPVIGIPFLADQPFNVQRMEQLGIGVGLRIEALTQNTFKEAIMKVADGESYHQNIVKVRKQLMDNPMSGMERAVWWTEYVMRHGGARHLRSPSADVSWLEYFMLDVIGPLLLLGAVALATVYLVLRWIFIYLCSSFTRSKLKKQ